MFDLTHPEVWHAVERALAEDIGPGDVTTRFTVPPDLSAQGRFLAKQSFVLAGIELLQLIYRYRNGTNLEILKPSGTSVQPNNVSQSSQVPLRLYSSANALHSIFCSGLVASRRRPVAT